MYLEKSEITKHAQSLSTLLEADRNNGAKRAQMKSSLELVKHTLQPPAYKPPLIPALVHSMKGLREALESVYGNERNDTHNKPLFELVEEIDALIEKHRDEEEALPAPDPNKWAETPEAKLASAIAAKDITELEVLKGQLESQLQQLEDNFKGDSSEAVDLRKKIGSAEKVILEDFEAKVKAWVDGLTVSKFIEEIDGEIKAGGLTEQRIADIVDLFEVHRDAVDNLVSPSDPDISATRMDDIQRELRKKIEELERRLNNYASDEKKKKAKGLVTGIVGTFNKATFEEDVDKAKTPAKIASLESTLRGLVTKLNGLPPANPEVKIEIEGEISTLNLTSLEERVKNKKNEISLATDTDAKDLNVLLDEMEKLTRQDLYDRGYGYLKRVREQIDNWVISLKRKNLPIPERLKEVDDKINSQIEAFENGLEIRRYTPIGLVERYLTFIDITTPEAKNIFNAARERIGNLHNEQLKRMLVLKIVLHKIGFSGWSGKNFSSVFDQATAELMGPDVTFLDMARACFFKQVDIDEYDKVKESNIYLGKTVSVEDIDAQEVNQDAIDIWEYTVDRIAGRILPDASDPTDADFSYKVLTDDRISDFKNHLKHKFAGRLDKNLLDVMISYCENLGARTVGYVPWLAKESTRSHGAPADLSLKFQDEMEALNPIALHFYGARRYKDFKMIPTSDFLTDIPEHDVIHRWNTGDTLDKTNVVEVQASMDLDLHQMKRGIALVDAYRRITWAALSDWPEVIHDLRSMFTFDLKEKVRLGDITPEQAENMVDLEETFFPTHGEVPIIYMKEIQKMRAAGQNPTSKKIQEMFGLAVSANYKTAYEAMKLFKNGFTEPVGHVDENNPQIMRPIDADEVEHKFEWWIDKVLGKAKLIKGKHHVLFGPYTVKYMMRLFAAYEYSDNIDKVAVLINKLLELLKSAGGATLPARVNGFEGKSLYEYVRTRVQKAYQVPIIRSWMNVPAEFTDNSNQYPNLKTKYLQQLKEHHSGELGTVESYLPLLTGNVYDDNGRKMVLSPPWQYAKDEHGADTRK